MRRVIPLRWIFVLIFILVFYLPAVYSNNQTTFTPPPAAVPEGNIFTAAAFVGTGLYLLWLKGRKE